MSAVEIPAAAKNLIKELEGWSVETNAGSGPCEFSTYGEYRGDGTRPIIKVDEIVDSYLVRARHVDGRAFVAIWIRRPGLVLANGVTAKKIRSALLLLAARDELAGAALVGLVAMLTQWSRKGWKLDMAWRGKRRGEFAPKQITATELKAYIEPVLAMDLKEAA